MNTVRVTGNTFDHRETLKKLGGRWDGSAKNWLFEYVVPKDLATLKGLSGCLVVGDTPPPPIEPIEYDWFEKIRARVEARESEGVTADRVSRIYGDDQTYFNYFKDKNPQAFFGFSSLGEMTKYIEAIPQHKRGGSRDQGFDTGDAKWRGSPNMNAAIKIARDGWPEGLEKSSQVLELLNLENAIQRKRSYSVAGGSVSVGRLLAGNPAHMVRRPKRPGRRSITLFVENTASSFIKPEMLIIRAAIVAAFADILEGRGYSCQLVAVTMQARSLGDPGAQTAVTIKHAGEKLNLADIVFALGHPSFLRRFNFACVSSADECRSIWHNQGVPANAFGSEMNRNEFYVPHVTRNYQGDFMEVAHKMLPIIKPDGLPLEITGSVDDDED